MFVPGWAGPPHVESEADVDTQLRVLAYGLIGRVSKRVEKLMVDSEIQVGGDLESRGLSTNPLLTDNQQSDKACDAGHIKQCHCI